jgi:hypothetical protein
MANPGINATHKICILGEVDFALRLSTKFAWMGSLVPASLARGCVVRGVVRVAVACIAAALTVAGVDCAFAETEANGEHVDRYLLFSGFDVWRNGGFVHGGFLWSPDGLAREGFSLKLLLAGGSYRYQSGTIDITGQQALAAVMPGWRFKGDRIELTVFAAPTCNRIASARTILVTACAAPTSGCVSAATSGISRPTR